MEHIVINHPPVITIDILGMFTIPTVWLVRMTLLYPHFNIKNHSNTMVIGRAFLIIHGSHSYIMLYYITIVIIYIIGI